METIMSNHEHQQSNRESFDSPNRLSFGEQDPAGFPGMRIRNNCDGASVQSEDHDEDPDHRIDESSTIKRRRHDEDQFQRMLRTRQIEFLAKRTHFNHEEVRSLNTIFMAITTLAKTPGRLDRHAFRKSFSDIFGLTNSMMLDHTFNHFDIHKDGTITFSEWVANLSVLLRGSFDEQIEYCYRVYDLDGDEAITRQEVMGLVQGSILNVASQAMDEDDADHVTELTDMVMKKLDRNGNGMIPLRKFRKAVRGDPMLVQCLGPCLADPRKMEAFLATFTENFQSFSTNYTQPRVGECHETDLSPDSRTAIKDRRPSYNKPAGRGGLHKNDKKVSLTLAYVTDEVGTGWLRHVQHSQQKRKSLQSRRTFHAVRVPRGLKS